MDYYLALDLGTRTGWAMAGVAPRGGVQIQSGVQSFAVNPRFEGGGMRFLRFQHWLKDMLPPGPVRIAYEEVRFAATTDAAHVYGGFLATLTAWCEAHNVPYEATPIGTIKKHATGKGNASKADMVAAAVKRGHATKDDNEADALALLYWMIDTYGTPGPDHVRPAPDRQPQGRVPVGAVSLPRRPVSR